MENPATNNNSAGTKPLTFIDYFDGIMGMVALFAFIGPAIGVMLTGARFGVIARPGFFFVVLGAFFIGVIPFALAGGTTGIGISIIYKLFPAAPKRRLPLY